MVTPEELQAHQRVIEAQARLIDLEAARNLPLGGAYSEIHDMTMRFPYQTLEEIESELHILWSTILHTAIITTADDVAQDLQVEAILQARELGPLGLDDALGALTARGDVWSGLPFLVEDVSSVWLEKLMYLKTDDKLNLAAFTARLVKAGVRGFELGYCAVFVLRETLETPRPLQVTEYYEIGRSVADLLPAAVAWFKFAGHRLAAFSGGNGHEPLSGGPSRLTAVGQLAREAGVLEPGFSTKRWRFWQQKLEALSLVDNKRIREQAQQGLDSMSLCTY